MENETVTRQQASILAQLKIRTMGCNPGVAAALEEGDRREIPLARIYGSITHLIQGHNDDDTSYLALGGRFQGQVIQAGVESFGRVYESGKLFMPPGVMEVLIAAVRAEGVEETKRDGRAKSVEMPIKNSGQVNFAFDIYVKKANNPSGITYVAKPLLEPTKADPMEEIRRAIETVQARLQTQLESANQKQLTENQKQLTESKKR